MPAGVADIFKIVVLAASTHAALAADGAYVRTFLGAEEHILELHHAGVGEQQRRVVRRHQRTRRYDRVTVATEVVEEQFADVGTFHVVSVTAPALPYLLRPCSRGRSVAPAWIQGLLYLVERKASVL